MRRHDLIREPDDFRALDPFFRIIELGLEGLTDGDHCFERLADDVVFDFVITVPAYPRRVVSRDNLMELYRGYGSTFFLDRCEDLRVHRSDSTPSIVLEYGSEGAVIATGYPYGDRYISVITLKDRKVSHWRDYLDPLRVLAARGPGDPVVRRRDADCGYVGQQNASAACSVRCGKGVRQLRAEKRIADRERTPTCLRGHSNSMVSDS
jgi:uncharacterized protein